MTGIELTTSISKTNIEFGGIFAPLVLIQYAWPDGISNFTFVPVFVPARPDCHPLMSLPNGNVLGSFLV